jgi:Icc-related predicted phosphoesterase
MTIIAALSDTHNQHFSRQMYPNYCMKSPDRSDILVHAGDFTVKGNMGEIHSFSDWVREVAPFFKAVIFIAGNHEWNFDINPMISKSYFKDIPNCYYLENTGVEIEGIKFWGTPMTKSYISVEGSKRRRNDGWAFGRDADKLAVYWDMIPTDTDVLITHSPAYGFGDFHKDMHLGCPDLLKRIWEIQPRIHIFGHIHSGEGSYKIGKTTSLNTSMVDDNYKIQKQSPTYISINE